MNIPLYARMNEFAPATAVKDAVEDVRGGQGEETHEDEGMHGTLFEQCAPGRDKANANSSESKGISTLGDAAQHAIFTADVPELRIGTALAEGNLTDGYKLHDVALFDSGQSDKSPLAQGVSEVTANGYEQYASENSKTVPQLELDFSSDATTAINTQSAAVEPSGGRQAAA